MYPEQEILRFEGQGLTYEALAERVARVAGALAALGVQAGDRVAVLETNTPAVVEALYATASLGAGYVPLNYRARPGGLAAMVAGAAPRLLLVGERYVEVAAEALARDRHGAAGGHAAPRLGLLAQAPPPDQRLPANVHCLAALAAEAAPVLPDEVAEDALAVLMFTS